MAARVPVPGRGSLLAAAAATALAGCASSSGPPALGPEPVPFADTLPIHEPDERDPLRPLRVLLFHTPLDLSEPLRVPEGEALDRTHFDDAVSSSWWERRMGYRSIDPRELARGATRSENAPAREGPLTVKEGKTQGVTPGFTLEDAKGDTYIVKFDPVDAPHLQTAPGVIVNRLMWGAGYHVPEDYFFVFDRGRLVLADDAEAGDRPMTEGDVEDILAKAPRLPDGRYFALASKYLDGIPKGPFAFEGRRKEDPNDHYAHEGRRDLRGLRVVSSWVNNTDMREGNTLDVYVEPGYLRHHIIDFGATLGSGSTRPKHPKDEMEQPPEIWSFLARLVTLGFYEDGWEDDPWDIPDPALGYVRAESFDPEEWNAHWHNPAFFAMTPADAYWGAKIVSSFSDGHIRAAVEEGGLPQAWMVDRLAATLATRRDIIVEHWFGQVSPVEEPEVVETGDDGFTLTFTDLGLERGPWTAAGTTYAWSFEDDAFDLEASGSARGSDRGAQRIEVRWGAGNGPGRDAAGRDELAELTLRVARPGTDGRAATVWLRWEGAGTGYRVVGLEH